MNVLVVEDDKDYAKYLKRLFQQQGIAVFESSNGPEALDLLKKEKIDLVFSDIVMPKFGGLELAKKLNHSHDIYLITGTYKGPLFIEMKLYADTVYFKDQINKNLIRDIARHYRVEAA